MLAVSQQKPRKLKEFLRKPCKYNNFDTISEKKCLFVTFAFQSNLNRLAYPGLNNSIKTMHYQRNCHNHR